MPCRKLFRLYRVFAVETLVRSMFLPAREIVPSGFVRFRSSMSKNDPGRFSGIWELRNVARISNGAITDTMPWEKPMPNPDKYSPSTEQLLATCRRFLHHAKVG